MFVLMSLANYISDLLYRHECVIIPELGAIISRRVPAQHFLSSHTIYPPKRGLSFNPQITQGDGLLENHIASTQRIPYEAARRQVADYVRAILSEIEEEGTVTLYKIGRFYLNENHKIEFTPMYVLNYLPEAFGLATQELYPVDRTTKETTPVVIPEDEDTTPVIPMVAAQAIDNEEEFSPAEKTGLPWLRYAAAGAILIGLSYAGLSGYENRKQEESLVIEQQAEDKLKEKVQEANIFISAPLPSIELTAAPQIKNFHIVAGAFREPANADKRVQQLQRKGFKSRVLGVNKYGLHNVSFDSYGSREEALTALTALKSSGYTTAWILSGDLPN